MVEVLSRRIENLVLEFDEDGNRTGKHIEVSHRNVTWEDVRNSRLDWFDKTDLWMLPDRYDQLSAEQQIELTSFRQELRENPQSYFDEEDTDSQGANNGCDNLPIPPEWL